MKALRYGISCLLLTGFAFVAACGGSTDDSSDSSGGGPGAGGKASTGGRSGVSAAGSTGFPANPACPATAPANASACTLSGTQASCEYTGMTCDCVRVRGGGGGMFPGGMAGAANTGTRQWECMAMLVCPAAKPTTGEACTPAAGSCRYAGMGNCTCGQSSKWACSGGGGPVGGTGGGFNGGFGGFNFGTGGFNFGTGGFNFGSGGTGTSTGGTTCPATKPAADTACTGTGACPYTGGGCVCSGDKWSCL